MARLFAILITLVVVSQSALGALHGSLIFCFGHGNEAAGFIDGSDAACGHQHGTPMPVPSDPVPFDDEEHDGSCCDDIRVTLAEFLTLPRFDEASTDVPMPARMDAWIVLAVEAGHTSRGPPDHSWADPSRDQHLAIVASTRLTL